MDCVRKSQEVQFLYPLILQKGVLRKVKKEYRHVAEISLGSAFELETHLLIVQQQGWFPKDKAEALLALTLDEQKMLPAFINRL